jgi:hypothetical protein
MNDKSSHPYLGLVSAIVGGLCLFNLTAFTPAAEAGCRPTGRYVGRTPVLKCSGPSRCRPTGRIKVVRGVRYQVLRCPR